MTVRSSPTLMPSASSVSTDAEAIEIEQPSLSERSSLTFPPATAPAPDSSPQVGFSWWDWPLLASSGIRGGEAAAVPGLGVFQDDLLVELVKIDGCPLGSASRHGHRRPRSGTRPHRPWCCKGTCWRASSPSGRARRCRGWAQWCPNRTAMPRLSRNWPTSCAWTPATSNVASQSAPVLPPGPAPGLRDGSQALHQRCAEFGFPGVDAGPSRFR